METYLYRLTVHTRRGHTLTTAWEDTHHYASAEGWTIAFHRAALYHPTSRGVLTIITADPGVRHYVHRDQVDHITAQVLTRTEAEQVDAAEQMPRQLDRPAWVNTSPPRP